MSACNRRIAAIKAEGKTPHIISGAAYVFVIDRRSSFIVSGWVCGVTGEHESPYKTCIINKDQRGREYICTEYERFYIDRMKEA